MRPARVPDELRAAPFTLAEARRAGLTREQLRCREWRRLFRTVYVWAGLPDTLDLRAQAVRRVIPPGAAVSGTTAAWLLGVDVRPRLDLAVEVTVSRESAVRVRPGLVVRRALLPPSDVTVVRGVPVTAPLRTAFDLARRPSLTEGVVGLDALLNRRLVTVEGVRAYLAEHKGWRGVRSAGQALGLADARAANPMESRLRMVVVLGGLPRPECQWEVRDEVGVLVAIFDLAYRWALLAIEYDGSDHAERRVRDTERDAAVGDLEGWYVLRYTATHVYQTPGLIVAQVGRRLRLAS